MKRPVYAEFTITEEMVDNVDWRLLLEFRRSIADEIRQEYGAPDLPVYGNIV